MKKLGCGFLILFALVWACLAKATFVDAQHAKGTFRVIHPTVINLMADSIVGDPTVSASFIDQVLAANHSPAAGTGEVMYSLGVKSHINPAYALAFFHYESSYGTQGVATVTMSLGNIRCGPNMLCYNGYRAYRSWDEGIADWYSLMQTVYLAHGLITIEQIIPVYAPASDGNNVQAYIKAAQNDVARWKRGSL